MTFMEKLNNEYMHNAASNFISVINFDRIDWLP